MSVRRNVRFGVPASLIFDPRRRLDIATRLLLSRGILLFLRFSPRQFHPGFGREFICPMGSDHKAVDVICAPARVETEDEHSDRFF